MEGHTLGVAQVAQCLDNPAPPFGLTGSSPLNRGLAAFGLEFLDGTAGLGELVDFEVLGARSEAGIDEGLVLPPMESAH
jgi:hypothetical protein